MESVALGDHERFRAKVTLQGGDELSIRLGSGLVRSQQVLQELVRCAADDRQKGSDFSSFRNVVGGDVLVETGCVRRPVAGARIERLNRPDGCHSTTWLRRRWRRSAVAHRKKVILVASVMSSTFPRRIREQRSVVSQMLLFVVLTRNFKYTRAYRN